jgi:polyhydroxybutyrate depolymerase
MVFTREHVSKYLINLDKTLGGRSVFSMIRGASERCRRRKGPAGLAGYFGGVNPMRLVVVLLLFAAAPAVACGPDSDCRVGKRSYRLYVPDTEGPTGAFLFAHGYRGSAAGAMGNAALRDLADRLGMAFVALDAEGPDWDLAHTPRAPEREEALEYGYVADVLDDLAQRIDLDQNRIVATGFSAGGMMTWTLACGMSEWFAGFVPMSGTFWDPVPESCPAPPANLVHFHGTEDEVVPLGGRPIGSTRQGDVPKALAMYRAHGGFGPATTVSAPDDTRCEHSESPAGLILEFCTFTGGHSFSTDRLRYGIEQVLGDGER